MALTWASKDPDEVLDYQVDWTTRIAGDTIASVSWVFPTGITVNSQSNTTTSATLWLQGGSDGETYEFLNRIVTAGGRTMDQTILLPIRSK